MRAEYDFSKAERGKFYRPLDKGYTVRVEQSDGTVVVNHYALAEGTILLAPDVREYFPDAESVNNALRTLISIAPKSRKKISKSRSGHKRAAQSVPASD